MQESDDPLCEGTDDGADQPLQLQKEHVFSATPFETTSPFDIFTAEQGLDTQLVQEETDDSLLPNLFVEETGLSLFRAPVDTIQSQDRFGTDERVPLQTSSMDVSVARSRMVGLSHRERVVGMALLLSIIVVLLAYTFWPFETAKPGIALHPVPNLAKGAITPLVKTRQPSSQATMNPVAQATAQPTMQSPLPLQTPAQETTLSPSLGSGTTMQMFVSFYGWTDNSPPGASIAYPGLHSSAGGVGTYANPITFSTSANEFSPGAIIYVSYLKKYFIMEDECRACDADWQNDHRYEIVLWIGGDANSSSSAINSCQDSLTPKSSVPVLVDPSSNLTVDTTPLFTDSGGCITL